MTTMPQVRRRSVALGNPLNRPGMVFDVLAVCFTVALAVLIVRAPNASGDYGQWLMVSRYFAGEDIPSYRNIEGVAPFIPLVLALLKVPISDPFDALNALRFILAVALPLSFYIAGASLFRSRAAGFMALVLCVVGTGRFLELFAFGGLLQIGSLIFMMLSLAALGQLVRSTSNEHLLWSLAAAAAALAVLSHAGSVVIVVPVVAGAALIVIRATQDRRTWKQWLYMLLPGAALGLLAVGYWLLILVPANQGYADNPATVSYRGPGVVFDTISASRITVYLCIFAGVTLGLGVCGEILRKRPAGFALVAWWALATWGLFLGSAMLGIATDYPRFVPPLLAPLVVAAGVGLAAVVNFAARVAWRGSEPPLMKEMGNVLLAALLLFAIFGPRHFDAFEAKASGYGVSERDSLARISAWIDENLPEDQSVLVLQPRDGKWIEGLTGESTVFSNKVRYSYREDEWERSLAADALIRSTSGLANGLMLAKYINSATGVAGEVPRDLLVAMNHDGEYIDFAYLPDSRAAVLAGDGEGGVLATLGALRPQSVERAVTDDEVKITTTATGIRRGQPVTWVRTVSMKAMSPVMDIIDEVTSPAPIRGIDIQLRSFSGLQITTLVYSDGAGLMLLPKMGVREPRMDLKVLDGGTVSQAEDGGLVVSSGGKTRLHMQLTAQTAGGSISELQVLYPPDLVDKYQIGAAVLRKDPAYPSRLARMEAVGLEPVLEAGSYVLLVRRETSTWRIPGWASDGGTPARGGLP